MVYLSVFEANKKSVTFPSNSCIKLHNSYICGLYNQCVAKQNHSLKFQSILRINTTSIQNTKMGNIIRKRRQPSEELDQLVSHIEELDKQLKGLIEQKTRYPMIHYNYGYLYR